MDAENEAGHVLVRRLLARVERCELWLGWLGGWWGGGGVAHQQGPQDQSDHAGLGLVGVERLDVSHKEWLVGDLIITHGGLWRTL